MYEAVTVEQRAHKSKCLKLLHSIKIRDLKEIQSILDSNFNVDSPITDTGMTALSAACSLLTANEDVPIFACILQHGADANAIDNAGRTSLHMAARSGNIIAVKILLTLPNIIKNPLTYGLEVPIHLAAHSGCIFTLAELLNGGCNPFYYNGLG